MRVYGYVRVSTKGQAPGTSLDEQTAEILEKYPTAVIVREVASGASERPEFVKICEQLESGDTLAVCKLDRFCRTAKEGLGYVDYLRGKGVAVHILNMGVIVAFPEETAVTFPLESTVATFSLLDDHSMVVSAATSSGATVALMV